MEEKKHWHPWFKASDPGERKRWSEPGGRRRLSSPSPTNGAQSSSQSDPHGHARLLTGFFGSTASSLLRASRVPVLVVRQADAGTPVRVLVAVDDREATEGVLDAALDVAAAHDGHVIGFYALEGTPREPWSKGTGARVEPEVRRATEAWLEDTLVGAGFPEGRVETAVGSRVRPVRRSAPPRRPTSTWS